MIIGSRRSVTVACRLQSADGGLSPLPGVRRTPQAQISATHAQWSRAVIFRLAPRSSTFDWRSRMTQTDQLASYLVDICDIFVRLRAHLWLPHYRRCLLRLYPAVQYQ